MLERTGLRQAEIRECLESAYGLSVVEIEFLPLGADLDTVAYRVAADDGAHYFLKLRRGVVSEAVLALPHRLARAGMRGLIPPLATRRTGALRARLDPYTAILYPFVRGLSGWDIQLSQRQWIDLGKSLRELHASALPPEIASAIPREDYTSAWRERVGAAMGNIPDGAIEDPIAGCLARLLREKQADILRIVSRAGELADLLGRQPIESCLCHGDIHAGNVLVDETGRLYLVDWDTLVIAPRERDLMFIGAGIGGIWNREREVEWFFRGYGQAAIDSTALTYYRYERIAQDIAVTCEALLGARSEGTDSAGGGAAGGDRADMLGQLQRQFETGNVVDIAFATDRRLLEARGNPR